MVEIKKFECSKCGNCCKTFSFSEKKETPYFDDDGLICLNHLTLPLYDWEANMLREEAKEDSIVPYKIIFDKKNNRCIVLQYTLNENTCPFFVDDSCSVYNERPSTCRMFPCAIKLGDVDKESKGGIDIFAFTNHCSSEINREDLLEMIGLNKEGSSETGSVQVNKNIYFRYGDSYVHCLVKDVIDKTLMKFVQSLIDNGEIEPAKPGYPIQFLEKRISNSNLVNISELYKQSKGEDLAKVYNVMFEQVKAIMNK